MSILLLSTALAHHEDALRASLQASYGIRLLPGGGGRTDPERTPLELSDLVKWLPAGSPLWQAMGGPAAISQESRELRRVAFTLRILDFRMRGSKGQKPKPDPEPQWDHEKREQQAVMARKAEAFLRRQASSRP